MKMIQTVIRPERLMDVVEALDREGIVALTRFGVFGRGKQKGLQVGEIFYDELPKEMILIVVEEEKVQIAVDTILSFAKTGIEGVHGDGKIFISDVERSITISDGREISN